MRTKKYRRIRRKSRKGGSAAEPNSEPLSSSQDSHGDSNNEERDKLVSNSAAAQCTWSEGTYDLGKADLSVKLKALDVLIAEGQPLLLQNFTGREVPMNTKKDFNQRMIHYMEIGHANIFNVGNILLQKALSDNFLELMHTKCLNLTLNKMLDSSHLTGKLYKYTCEENKDPENTKKILSINPKRDSQIPFLTNQNSVCDLSISKRASDIEGLYGAMLESGVYVQHGNNIHISVFTMRIVRILNMTIFFIKQLLHAKIREYPNDQSFLTEIAFYDRMTDSSDAVTIQQAKEFLDLINATCFMEDGNYKDIFIQIGDIKESITNESFDGKIVNIVLAALNKYNHAKFKRGLSTEKSDHITKKITGRKRIGLTMELNLLPKLVGTSVILMRNVNPFTYIGLLHFLCAETSHDFVKSFTEDTKTFFKKLQDKYKLASREKDIYKSPDNVRILKYKGKKGDTRIKLLHTNNVLFSKIPAPTINELKVIITNAENSSSLLDPNKLCSIQNGMEGNYQHFLNGFVFFSEDISVDVLGHTWKSTCQEIKIESIQYSNKLYVMDLLKEIGIVIKNHVRVVKELFSLLPDKLFEDNEPFQEIRNAIMKNSDIEGLVSCLMTESFMDNRSKMYELPHIIQHLRSLTDEVNSTMKIGTIKELAKIQNEFLIKNHKLYTDQKEIKRLDMLRSEMKPLENTKKMENYGNFTKKIKDTIKEELEQITEEDTGTIAMLEEVKKEDEYIEIKNLDMVQEKNAEFSQAVPLSSISMSLKSELDHIYSNIKVLELPINRGLYQVNMIHLRGQIKYLKELFKLIIDSKDKEFLVQHEAAKNTIEIIDANQNSDLDEIIGMIKGIDPFVNLLYHSYHPMNFKNSKVPDLSPPLNNESGILPKPTNEYSDNAGSDNAGSDNAGSEGSNNENTNENSNGSSEDPPQSENSNEILTERSEDPPQSENSNEILTERSEDQSQSGNPNGPNYKRARVKFAYL